MGMTVMLEMDILMKVVPCRSRVHCSFVQELLAIEAKMRVRVQGRGQLKSPHTGKGDLYEGIKGIC
jgi:hypothetical protein